MDKRKFYNRFYSLFDYKPYITYFEEIWDVEIFIPKNEPFMLHLKNIQRLIEFEFGGVYEIVYWNESDRIISTNLPKLVFKGINNTDWLLTNEQNEKLKFFLKNKKVGELIYESLF